jgi:hypothetical protein
MARTTLDSMLLIVRLATPGDLILLERVRVQRATLENIVKAVVLSVRTAWLALMSRNLQLIVVSLARRAPLLEQDKYLVTLVLPEHTLPKQAGRSVQTAAWARCSPRMGKVIVMTVNLVRTKTTKGMSFVSLLTLVTTSHPLMLSVKLLACLESTVTALDVLHVNTVSLVGIQPPVDKQIALRVFLVDSQAVMDQLLVVRVSPEPLHPIQALSYVPRAVVDRLLAVVLTPVSHVREGNIVMMVGNAMIVTKVFILPIRVFQRVLPATRVDILQAPAVKTVLSAMRVPTNH